MNITSGIIPSAQKVIIYGPEGIGKSTFASKFPDPLFSDTEGSTKKLNVKRFDAPSSWEMLLQQAEYVKTNKPCKTYVIDTADWAENLCSQALCAKAKKSGIEDFGYGRGYIYLKEEFGRLLNKLDEIIEQGIHVVFTAHSYLRKFDQPDEMGSYDRYEMKLTKFVAPMLKEWADTVLFANYKTYVVSDENGKKKAQGGNRMMFTTHTPCWDAKNRDGLPDELPFDFEQISHIIAFNSNVKTVADFTPAKNAEQQVNEMIEHDDFTEVVVDESTSGALPNKDEILTSSNPVIQQLYDLMNEKHISKELLQYVVADNGYFPKDTPIESYGEDFISGCLIAAWPQVLRKINDYENLPF